MVGGPVQGLPTLLVLVKGYGAKKGHSHEVHPQKKGEAADDKKVPKAKSAPYKRPASKPDTPMSLEEKMELFAKSKQQNVTQFLDQLSDAQRQALWQRFSRARDALKDEDTTAMWNSVCKGKNSDPMKKKLLGIFLNEGTNLKNSTAWQKEKVTWSQSSGILDAPCVGGPVIFSSCWYFWYHFIHSPH